jgi:hypothetical protein
MWVSGLNLTYGENTLAQNAVSNLPEYSQVQILSFHVAANFLNTVLKLKIMGVLQDIENFISTQSALRFADIIEIEKLKDKSGLYEEYSIDGSELESIIVDRLRVSCLHRYKTHIEAYAGFIECGRVFVLNRADKILFFLAGNEDGVAWLIPHYNPLSVDVIEQRTSNNEIFHQPSREIWDFSKDEERMINELNSLL